MVDNYQQVEQLKHLDLEGAKALERAAGETWCHRIEPYWKEEALCEFGEAFEDNVRERANGRAQSLRTQD